MTRIEDIAYIAPERLGGARHTHPPGATDTEKCLRPDDNHPPEHDDEPHGDHLQHEDTP